eukprot:2362461-Karenia_brevis.AAC.1
MDLTHKRPHKGLSTRGFKRAMAYSEVAESPTRSKAKMMETVIFTSHPVMPSTLQKAVQRATLEATQNFEARLTKAVYGMAQGSSKDSETCPDTGENPHGSVSSCTPPINKHPHPVLTKGHRPPTKLGRQRKGNRQKKSA